MNRLLFCNHSRKEIIVTKTAIAKNLNATFSKKKATSQQDKDTKALARKLAKITAAPVIPVPEHSTVKKATKDELSWQVIDLTKALNGANKAVEELGIQSTLALHDLGIAKRTIKEMKRGVK